MLKIKPENEYDRGIQKAQTTGFETILADLSPIEEHTLPFYRSLIKNDFGKVRIEAVQDGHEFSNSKKEIVQIILGWLMME